MSQGHVWCLGCHATLDLGDYHDVLKYDVHILVDNIAYDTPSSNRNNYFIRENAVLKKPIANKAFYIGVCNQARRNWRTGSFDA